MKESWTLEYKLNTSNLNKLKEFQRLFQKQGHTLIATDHDIREIDADPLNVIVHKVSQLPPGVLVEDTVLEIESEKVGIHVKWLLEHLSNCIGKKAEWIVYLAVHNGAEVTVFRGKISGKIVKERGNDGFGFDKFFQPENSEFTLAEKKPDRFNARALAVEAFLGNDVFEKLPVNQSWSGPWQ